MITRRDFIKTMSLLSGAVLTSVRWLGKWAGVQPAQEEEPPEAGELYAGFVLLPEGAQMPPFVSCASAPILCQVENEQDKEVVAFRGETVRYESVEDLRRNLSFPLYIPTLLPSTVELVGVSMVRFVQSKNIFKTRIDFGLIENKQPLISLWSQPEYPKPFPVFPLFEKIDYTPSLGVLIPTAEGHVFHWISNEILYTLVVEHDSQRDMADAIAKSLVKQ